MTDAPFSALGNARTFLSSQLQKTSERTFDHSIELRTPYRRAIECYPVYGMERDSKDNAARDGSEGKKDMFVKPGLIRRIRMQRRDGRSEKESSARILWPGRNTNIDDLTCLNYDMVGD